MLPLPLRQAVEDEVRGGAAWASAVAVLPLAVFFRVIGPHRSRKAGVLGFFEPLAPFRIGGSAGNIESVASILFFHNLHYISNFVILG